MSSYFHSPTSHSDTDWHSSVIPACQLKVSDPPLMSANSALNDFFNGGLPWGYVCEWGSPWGTGGRELILTFLQQIQSGDQHRSPFWSLWVQGQQSTQFYAPALHSRSVDLNYLRFAYTKSPLKDLKALFMESFFKVIVLDSSYLSSEDCAFLKRQAKQLKQVIILVRPYFLSEKKGNVWAKTRLNCSYDTLHNEYSLSSVKGLSPRRLVVHSS